MNYQEILLKEIRQIIGSETSINEAISNVLQISYDAAHRRISMKSKFSIEETVIASSESLEEQASLKLDIENIQKVLKELSDDHQDLIIWRYIDELSVPEIVEITGKSEGNVRVGIHRALQALKKRLPLITS